jgi:DnaJ-class molecular chaperone
MATRLKNFYAVLELEPFTDLDEVKQAFRRLARKVHPDLNGGTADAQEQFKAINEAYDILGHADKKLHYDLTLRQLLQLPNPTKPTANTKTSDKPTKPIPSPKSVESPQTDAKNQSGQASPSEKIDTNKQSTASALGNLLDGFLKGRSVQSNNESLPPSEDQQATTASDTSSKTESKQTSTDVDKPKEANSKSTTSKTTTSTVSKDIKADAPPPSEQQKATQIKAPFPTSAQDVIGAGPIRGEDVTVETTVTPAEAEHGVIKMVNVEHRERCRSCSGSGRLNGLMCPTCHGDKVISRIKKLDVRLPAGIKTGSRVRVTGEGGRGVPDREALKQGKTSKPQNGDLYLLIRVVGSVHKPPPKSIRRPSLSAAEALDLEGLTHVDGLNVHVELPIPVVDAVLGCERQVATIHGQILMTIPPLSSSGKVLRLKQQGLTIGSQTGDQLVTLQLYAPQSLSDAEKRLFEALRALAG